MYRRLISGCIFALICSFFTLMPLMHADAARDVEIQAEYLDHRFYDDRTIDSYTVHVFEKVKQNGSISLHRGLTLTRATGYNTEHHRKMDSNAWGIGPAAMIRWERPLSGKLYWDLEGSGSFLIYDRAFPARGRPWGFMWRIGPRLTYKFGSHNALSLGYMLMHSSNGMGHKNPGLDAVGFSLGYVHSF